MAQPADFLRAPSRRRLLQAGALGTLAPLLPSCTEVEAKPRAIKWGRDLCEFCHMVFADRRYVAEIWDRDYNRARIYDDFGCAVLAAAEKDVLDAQDVKFWVSDERKPETWLDARAARYRDGMVSPMGYGHAAGTGPDYTLDFASAAKAIRIKADCEHKT